MITSIAWLLIVLMILPSTLYSSGDEGADQGNTLTRVVWLLLLVASVVMVLNRGAESWRVCRRLNIFLWGFMILAAASVLWSIDSAQTFRSLVRLAAMFLVSLAVAVAAWNPRRYQNLVRPILTASLWGSLAFGLLRPDIAIHHEQQPELLNAWHGLYATKNALGMAASFTFILWIHAWVGRQTNGVRAFFGAAVAAACLLLSKSQTSVITTLIATAALLLLMRPPSTLRRSVPYLTGALAIVILLYSLAMLKIVPGLEILVAPIPAITGKDLTFSNRSNIWAAVLDHVKIRPLLGSGYSAYWTMGTPTPDMESYAIKSKLQGFYPGSSHNGYIQVLNDLGAVGLCVLLAYLYVFVRDALRLYKLDRAQGALFLALLLQQMSENLTEPIWFNVLLLEFVLMTMASTCLARCLLATPKQALARPTQQGARGSRLRGLGRRSPGTRPLRYS